MALGLHLHESANLKIFDILLEDCQVFDEPLVEVRSLVKHIFKISLAHESEVDSLEEGLFCWVDGNSRLQLLELIIILRNNHIRCLNEVFLLANTDPDFVEFFFLLQEDFIFGLLASMYLHEMLDHIQIRQLCHGLRKKFGLLRFGAFDVVEGLFDIHRDWHLCDRGACFRSWHHRLQLLGRFTEDVELALLVGVSFFGVLVLTLGHVNLLSVHGDVLPVGLIETWGSQDGPLLFVRISHALVEVFLFLENGFRVDEHLFAVLSDGADVFQGARKIANCTLLLELGDLGRVRLRDVTRGGELVIGRW